ncbi:MAG: DoxX family protein [Candidatus Magasanikbacteria bacterium]|nr:DoxX family protein [Candidatus Magasanikbacteria bacterium]
MPTSQKISLLLLRFSLGWLFFYAGITKILNPEWTAAGYIKGAKSFIWFYQWLLSSDILPAINAINEWGLTLLGISLILGIGVRLSSYLGAILMMLYYFVRLDFLYPDANSLLVDQHIIYAFIMIYFAQLRAGRIWGLENFCSRLPICSKFPKLRNWLG